MKMMTAAMIAFGVLGFAACGEVDESPAEEAAEDISDAADDAADDVDDAMDELN